MSNINVGAKYKAIVVSHTIERDDRSGNDYVEVTLGVEDEAHKKRCFITFNGNNSETVLRISRAQLKATGFDPDTMSLKQIDENPLLLAGHECQCDFTIWQSNDGPVLQVNMITPKKVPKTPESIADLDKKLRSLKSDGKNASRGVSKAEASNPDRGRPNAKFTVEPVEDGSDIPF